MNIYSELNKQFPHDVDMIRDYIESYAGNDDYEATCCSITTDMSNILAPWAAAKEHLFDIFGQKFILSKPVIYRRSIDELAEELGDLFYNPVSAINHLRDHIYNHYQSPYDRWDCGKPFNFETTDEAQNFYQLLDSYALARNEWREDTCFIHGVKVQKGAKIIRTLKKIMESFKDEEGLAMFEDFRNAHSLVLNQKKLTGDLCLSIHPMDFMTMSDNDEGWDSCMSWTGCGDYRQGTVEMMNSAYVVIGYLHNPEEPMRIYPGNWNSKKWRCLYVVSKDIIIQVREYPYCNDELNGECLKWLKTLCEDYGEWKYEDTRCIFNANRGHSLQHGDDCIRMDFGTNHMYSDFRYEHECYLNLDTPQRINLNYSGVSECMCCGTTTDPNMNDNALVCRNCNGYLTCDYCEGDMDPDECYEVDGQMICRCCYENETWTCPICEDRDGYETRHLGGDCFDINIGIGKYISTRTINTVCYKHHEEIQKGDIDMFGKPRIYYNTWHNPMEYVRVEEFTDEGVESAFGGYYGLNRWLGRFKQPSQWWLNRDVGCSESDTYRFNDESIARSFIWYDDDGNEAYACAPEAHPHGFPHCRPINIDAFSEENWVLPEFVNAVKSKEFD